MATYCSSLSNEKDVLLPSLQDQKLGSNPESLVISSNAMYLDQSSTASSHGEVPPGGFLSHFSCVEIPSLGGRNEIISRTHLDLLDGEQDLQYRGLSLSLATQTPSADQASPFHCDCTKNGSSSLSSHIPNSGMDDLRKKESRHAEHLTKDLPGVAHNVIEVGAMGTSKCSISLKDMHCGPYLY